MSIEFIFLISYLLDIAMIFTDVVEIFKFIDPRFIITI